MNRPARFPREITVLYEDDAVIAVDKPAGLAAVPIEGSHSPSAWAILAEEMKRQRQKTFVVHRIDRFSSGVLLFAKTRAGRDLLVRQFLKHTPERQYLVVVRGHLSETEGTLTHHLRKSGMHQKVSREGERDAARAELTYSVEKPLRNATLVRVTLTTGLQNQIRVQFSAAGHPVIGDRKYRPAEANEKRIARVALHAAHLAFTHPVNGKTIAIDSPLPADMRSLIAALTRTDQSRGR